MTLQQSSRLPPDLAADQRANRTAFVSIAVFTFLSFLLLASSEHIEALTAGETVPGIEPWLVQGASHLAILAVMPILPILLTRFPLTRDSLPRNLVIWATGLCLFSVLHIVLMVGLRKLLWPILIGGTYEFGLSDPMIWLYEFRKDAYTFLLVAGVFWTSRHIEHLKLQAMARRQDAESKGRLTLSSGGHVFQIEADQIEHASAAANYVEVTTRGRSFLARMTLAELERLLMAAGANHVRIHRSHLVHRSQISEVHPKGDGAALVTLKSGNTLVASRSYRKALDLALST